MAAFGKTRLQIINAVLPRMRESEVATSSSTLYANLVATVLNSVKSQIENAWMWRAMRDTYTVTATSGVSSYALTSSGSFAKIIDMWNTTTASEVGRATTADFNDKFFGTTSVQTGDISQYNQSGLDVNYDVQFDVWPVPTATNTLKVNVYLPTADPTADSTVLLIPNQVLIEGMVAYMMAERGDDGSQLYQAQQALYMGLLSDAIAAEVGQDESEAAWTPND